MRVNFNPQEALAYISNIGVTALFQKEGMPQETATMFGGVAEGVIKGLSIEKKAPTPLDKWEKAVKAAIHKTMQLEEYEHLPQELECEIYEKIFAVELMNQYLTEEESIEIFEKKIKSILAESKIYDENTFSSKYFADKLIENIKICIDEETDLVVLSTLYSVREIKTILKNHILNVSEFEKAILNIRPIYEYKYPNELHYLNDKIGFYGREDEHKKLDEFRNMADKLKYVLVQGYSGVGKSRLLCEYIKTRNEEEDWYFCFLNNSVIESLMDYPSYECSKNILFVIDYAGRYSEIIGKWILKLAESKLYSKKIRIVLIERQEKIRITTQESLVPWLQTFYGDSHQTRVLKENEYENIILEQLDEENLHNIIDDYTIKVANKPTLSYEEKKAIIEYVSCGLKIELQHQTPLFVLLATDAFLQEGFVKNWDVDLLMQNYIKRMQEYWIEGICKGDKELYNSLFRIIVFATAVGGFDLNGTVPDYIKNDYEKLTEHEECRTLLENTSGLDGEIILPIQPDYIGEFIFLKYLKELFPKKNQKIFCDSLYYKPMEFMSFFMKCMDDFSYSTIFGSVFENIIECLRPIQETSDNYMVYAGFVLNYASKVPQKNRRKYIEEVENIFEREDVEDSRFFEFIKMWYMETLVSMTFSDKYDGSADMDFTKIDNWKIENAYNSINKLREIYTRYDGWNIASYLARSLANCSIYNTYENAKKCIDEIEILYAKYGEIEPELALSLSMALNNAISKITLSDGKYWVKYAEKALKKLENLYQEYVVSSEDYSDVQICVINAVSDSKLREQVNEEIPKLYAKLKKRQKRIAIEYAKALNNMVGLYGKAFDNRANMYFDKLEKLYYQYKEQMVEIVIEYAKGIVAYIITCPKEKTKQMMYTVRDLCNEYKNDRKVYDILIIRYIKLVHNRLNIALYRKETVDNIDEIHSDMAEIYNDYKDKNEEIAHFCTYCSQLIKILVGEERM